MILSNIQLIYPMCVLFFLTVVVLGKLGFARFKAVRGGKVKISFYRSFSTGQEPEESAAVSRHFSNLFEAPVLFYVVCILGMIIPVQGIFFIVLAWIYVAARIAHAFIHLGPNNVLVRMKVYAFGWLALIAMWITIFAKAISISLVS